MNLMSSISECLTLLYEEFLIRTHLKKSKVQQIECQWFFHMPDNTSYWLGLVDLCCIMFHKR